MSLNFFGCPSWFLDLDLRKMKHWSLRETIEHSKKRRSIVDKIVLVIRINHLKKMSVACKRFSKNAIEGDFALFRES